MKIVLLLSNIDMTGMTTNTLDLATGLVDLGHDVHLITGGVCTQDHALHHLEAMFNDSGVKIHKIKEFTSARHKSHKLISAFYSLVGVLKASIKLKMINPDVVHACSPYLSFIPYYLNEKFTSTIHVNDLVNNFYYKKPDKVIAISKETKDYAIQNLDYREDQVEIVLHGVSKRFSIPCSASDIKDIVFRYKIPVNKIYIGIVASIEKRKGHDLLFKAIAALSFEIQQKIHVIAVGSPKSHDLANMKWFNECISSNNLTDLVTHVEYQDPKPFYDLFDIFVLPSRLEGFPLVVLEAMLSSCLCIRSNVEGAQEQIIHNVDGFLFENENYVSLSQILSNVIINPKIINEFKIKAKAKAMENFTLDVMAKNTLNVYKQVLGSN